MTEKELKVRIQHKHDFEANWLKATNFIPLVGEIVVYDPDENYKYPRIKIGDGKTNIINLPFITKDFAKITDIPTKPADIGAQPAGNYLTSIPSEYITESELDGKITTVQTAVDTEKSRAEGIEAGLDNRLKAVEAIATQVQIITWGIDD